MKNDLEANNLNFVQFQLTLFAQQIYFQLFSNNNNVTLISSLDMHHIK